MIQSELIQRAKFADNPSKTGIDKILQFDYMGASEYEFGALPKSLKRMRANSEDYSYLETIIKGVQITVYIQSDLIEFATDFLNKLAENKVRTKCSTWFKDSLQPNKEDDYLNADFWWAIDSDFMFWEKNDAFDSKFRELINQ